MPAFQQYQLLPQKTSYISQATNNPSGFSLNSVANGWSSWGSSYTLSQDADAVALSLAPAGVFDGILSARIGTIEIISDLCFSLSQTPVPLVFPISVKAGQTIEWRIGRAVTGSNLLGGNVAIVPAALSGSRIVPIGPTATVGVSPWPRNSGTIISGGNNAFGAWTEMNSSTSGTYIGVFPFIGVNNIVTGRQSNRGTLQFGIGPAGSEVAFWSMNYQHTNTGFGYSPVQFFPINIPVGSRISARIFTSGTAQGASDLYNVQLHGLVP